MTKHKSVETVIETHPDQEATLDLRLYSPWPELEQHALSIDFSTSDTHEYAHIPPLVILLRALHNFKKTHEGRLPKTYAEKKALQQAIREMKKGGVHADEENFEDAIGMVMKAVKPTEVPSGIKSLFKDPACEKLTASVSSDLKLHVHSILWKLKLKFLHDCVSHRLSGSSFVH